MEEVKPLIKHIEKAILEDLLNFDGIIVGYPAYCGTLTRKLKKFFDESVKIAREKAIGKTDATFASLGTLKKTMKPLLYSILTVLMNYGYLAFGFP